MQNQCPYVKDKGQCSECDGRFVCSLADGHEGPHKTHDGYEGGPKSRRQWYLDAQMDLERELLKNEAHLAVMRAALQACVPRMAHDETWMLAKAALDAGAGETMLAKLESLADGNLTYQTRDAAFQADAEVMREALSSCLSELRAWLDNVGLTTQVERAIEVSSGKALRDEVAALRTFAATVMYRIGIGEWAAQHEAIAEAIHKLTKVIKP